MMQRSKWYALVFLLGAFVAGAAIGFAAERAMGHGPPGRHGPRSPLDRMSRDLDLTPQQRAAFDTILENREKQMRQLFAPIQPQMDSLMKIGKVIGDSTHQQLKRVLTPEQQVKFDRFRAESRKRGDSTRKRWDMGPGQRKP
jgi:Spy/CpxP family protein refolding chaperone